MGADWKTAAQIVTPEKIKWAIDSFETYKTPGPDGIFPKMLQVGCESIIKLIAGIFRGSIATGYIPEVWKTSRVSFIPKPGRGSYSSVKDFRPICLTSFMLKTMERLIDIHIRQTVLITSPISSRQHAYTTGRSTETALHSVVKYIEDAWNSKETVVGAFVDIEGAFNSTTRTAIRNALTAKGITFSIRRWIMSSLSNREVYSEWKGKLVRGKVNEGCPQGGVISPLLWNLVADGLLRKLEEERIFAIAYADDFALLVRGKYEEVLPELVQGALVKVSDWCQERSLGINPRKTEVVAFTRKYKSKIKSCVTFHGQSIPYMEGVKYLGVYLDKKLLWGQHLRMQSKKIINILMQCRSAIGTDWGLEPQKVLWIYKTILRPGLTYAALVWWKVIKNKTSARVLDHIQAVSLRGAFGLRRSTPTAAVRMLLGLDSLDLEITRTAARSAYRMICSGQWDNNAIGHATICKAMLGGSIRGSPQDRITKTLCFGQRYQIRIPSIEDWNNNLKLGGDIWFTDGSRTDSGTGFGICGPERSLNSAYKLNKYNTVFQAEVAAIETCARGLVQQGIRGRRINICANSAAALKALDQHCTTSLLVKEAREALNDLAKVNKVCVIWIPKLLFHKGNMKANLLAKQGCSSDFYRVRETAMPYREGCDEIERNLENSKITTWNKSRGYRWSKDLLGSISICLCPNLTGCRLKLGASHLDHESFAKVDVLSLLGFCSEMKVTETMED